MVGLSFQHTGHACATQTHFTRQRHVNSIFLKHLRDRLFWRNGYGYAASRSYDRKSGIVIWLEALRRRKLFVTHVFARVARLIRLVDYRGDETFRATYINMVVYRDIQIFLEIQKRTSFVIHEYL